VLTRGFAYLLAGDDAKAEPDFASALRLSARP
jgi:hypothetical protein